MADEPERKDTCSEGETGAESAKDEKVLAEHIVNVANMSIRAEYDKTGFLLNQAGQLLACVTILSVAYLTPLQQVVSLGGLNNAHWLRLVGLFYLAMILPLVVALVITLLSLRLKETSLLSSPKAQYDYFSSVFEKGRDAGKSLNDLAIAKNHCDSLEVQYDAALKKNKWMNARLKFASGLVVTSAIVAAAGIVLLYVSIL